MKRRLLDLLVCPHCRGTFRLEVFKEQPSLGWEPRDGTCPESYATEVVEGALHCSNCGDAFPVINGVPRLLRAELLAKMKGHYPDFFAQHPEFLPRVMDPGDPLADTLESFTRQRLYLHPPSPKFSNQWTEHLRRNLGTATSVDDLRDAMILDVGCGFGRHLYVANNAGAETVGVDLSGGVDVAQHNNRHHPRCHIVQANILERPFREACFDIVWSFGVLHHMPDPRAGFEAMVPFAHTQGGLIVIWVYGWSGMAFTYRLSHMRSLHRLVRRMSGATRLRVSKMVTGALSGLYWEPLRLAQRIGLRRVVERLPLTEYIEHDWIARVAGVHDRLSTPITHFHDRDELLGWIRSEQLIDENVETTSRRGWRAYGRRQMAVSAP